MASSGLGPAVRRPWACRAAAGWKVGSSTRPWNGWVRPRSRVIPVVVSSSVLAAKFPRVTTTLGSTSRIWASSQGRQAAISSGWGSRFCGGRLFTTLQM